jgi:hypothetical protein
VPRRFSLAPRCWEGIGYAVDDFSEYLGLALVVFAVGALAAAYVSGL